MEEARSQAAVRQQRIVQLEKDLGAVRQELEVCTVELEPLRDRCNKAEALASSRVSQP